MTSTTLQRTLATLLACMALATMPHARAADARTPVAGSGARPCPELLSRTVPRLQDDAPQNLCQYADQVILVVNTASYCGFTKQYEGLEKLYSKYRERGFVVLGFPSNDFGQQEPGSARQIADFCENTFGVKFPMFAKTKVVGADADPLFSALARQSGSTPRWNFHKYLIGRDGSVAGAYGSRVDPFDRSIVQDIERSLLAPQSPAAPRPAAGPRSDRSGAPSLPVKGAS